MLINISDALYRRLAVTVGEENISDFVEHVMDSLEFVESEDAVEYVKKGMYG